MYLINNILLINLYNIYMKYYVYNKQKQII